MGGVVAAPESHHLPPNTQGYYVDGNGLCVECVAMVGCKLGTGSHSACSTTSGQTTKLSCITPRTGELPELAALVCEV